MTVLHDYSFCSLLFCQTDLLRYRDKFANAFNIWYLDQIRQGGLPLLTLCLDIGNLMLRPALGPLSKALLPLPGTGLQTLEEYRDALHRLRQQLLFRELVESVGRATTYLRKVRAVREILHIWHAEYERRFARIPLNLASREYELAAAVISRKGLSQLRGRQLVVSRIGDRSWQSLPSTITFGQLSSTLESTPEDQLLSPIEQSLRSVSQFIREHPLESFFHRNHQLLVELAAHSPRERDTADLQFIAELAHLKRLPKPDESKIKLPLVQRRIPTDSMQAHGQVDGPSDVQRSTSLSDLCCILPAEYAFWFHQEEFFRRVLNDGVTILKRHAIEYVEPELRILCLFVIDARKLMRDGPASGSHRLPASDDRTALANPYVRARALVAGMLRDLATHFPREDVRLDAAIYLSSPPSRLYFARSFRLFDEFAPVDVDSDMSFARKFVEAGPSLCDYQVLEPEYQGATYMGPDPLEFLQRSHAAQGYHCRHVIVCSRQDGLASLINWLGDPGYLGSQGGRDMLATIGFDRALHLLTYRRLEQLSDTSPARPVSDQEVRAQFLADCLAKAAGRPLTSMRIDLEETR